ncbi:MAG: hypothetical protein HQL52_03715 [Magnetococcales bacterium]|nr:hypothetical protein [Magnetococcales bacterium]
MSLTFKQPRRIITDILLLDVVDFSTLRDEDQFTTVSIINHGIIDAIHFIGIPAVLDEREIVRGMVPTGDGCYLILHESLMGYAPILALGLRNIILFKSRQASQVFSGIRLSVHNGVVIPFQDATGKVNYIGSGMNDCARLQSLPDHLKRTAESFSGDKNWVNVSQECWNASIKKFDYTRFSQMNFRYSDEVGFKDKHNISHICRFLELSRVWVSGL